jgi:peptidoglycan/LPS O-acetylase OafA/YrhL
MAMLLPGFGCWSQDNNGSDNGTTLALGNINEDGRKSFFAKRLQHVYCSERLHMNTNTVSSVFSDSKSHYKILDGLRGVAAIMVICMHIMEPFAGGDATKMYINHGYLAVDFFFLLSGFVIAHAYDDRWNKMSIKDFFKRRLIRLHPMIIIGMTIGAICFYFSASTIVFPPIGTTPVWKLILVMLIGYTLVPVPLSLDIRGWGEMHPLDGPAWTLFFEYIANIMYALVLRRTSKMVLAILTLIAAAVLIQYSVAGGRGDLIGGWSITPEQLRIGFTRLCYPFLAGMLLSRLTKPGNMGNTFVWCSLLLIIILSIPRVGGSNTEHFWINGLYEALSIIIIFPTVVYLGASGSINNKGVANVCRFLGDISYPVYIIHYPFIYIFTAWVVDNHKTFAQAWPVGLLLLVCVITLSYVFLKLYDIPVRKWLTKKYLPGRKNLLP